MHSGWHHLFELLLELLLSSVQDEEELGKLMKKDNETREVVREMRQKVDEAKSSLSSNRSRGKVLDALMHQKKSGRIPGIFGRLVKSCYINTQGHTAAVKCIVL